MRRTATAHQKEKKNKSIAIYIQVEMPFLNSYVIFLWFHAVINQFHESNYKNDKRYQNLITIYLV